MQKRNGVERRFLLDLHVDYCTVCKTAVGNLNSPKNKTHAQMQDDEPADYYDGDEYSEGLE